MQVVLVCTKSGTWPFENSKKIKYQTKVFYLASSTLFYLSMICNKGVFIGFITC
jgi:hypothetical protein